MKRINYRPEIDGLRAIAVLSVIIFHAGVIQLSGGFIGVDIFYVISGYLITNIILTSLEKGEFSFSNFYVRRIKRLLPAALFMVFVTLVFGSLILTPDKYMELSKSAIYANLFIANIWFMNHSGYFDLSTQIAPLVHMWSLSVEEQFYLLFPFILLISYRINGIKAVKLFIYFILTASFILSVVLSFKYPNFSFYMLFTRAWELGLGAMIAIHPSIKPNHKALSGFISLTGLGLIIYGLFMITHNDVYPGYLALFPVLGTVFIIYSLTHHTNVIKRILTLRPLLFLGKISYSSYLWHWPIIVYYRIYINQREFSYYEVLLLIIISIFVGYLSWKFIEERYRYRKYSNQKIYKIALSVILISSSLPAVVYMNKGFSSRVSESCAAITDMHLMNQWHCTEMVQIFPGSSTKYCVVGSPWNGSSEKGIVWGDSHSQHLAQLLHYEAQENNISLVIAPKSCPPYLNSKYVKEHYPNNPKQTEKCTQKNQLALEWLINNDEVKIVVMSSAWSGHVRMLYTDEQLANRSSASLKEKNAEIGAELSKKAFRPLLTQLKDKEILLIGDVPRPNKVLNECAASNMSSLLRSNCDESMYKYLDASSVSEWHKSSNSVLLSMEEEFKNITTIIPTDKLCDDKYCPTYINNELIYRDANHIRKNLNPDTAKLLSNTIGLHDYFSSRGKLSSD